MTLAAVHAFGIVAEPVSWGRRARGPEIALHVALDLASITALLMSVRGRHG